MADGNGNKGLLEPILEQGIRNTHYFNGRLLTAQDLKVDQVANREQHRQLGRGIGEGIIHGFEVRLVSGGTGQQPPVLAVDCGLALNSAGQVVALPIDIPELLLARRNPDLLPTAGLFAECDRPTNESPVTSSSVHVLTVTLASGFAEKAPKRGFGENGKVEGCGSRYAVEGVYFRLVELKLNDLTFLSSSDVTAFTNLMNATDAASLTRLRNLLAHLCYGTEQLSEFQADPFRLVNKRSPFTHYGAIDDLRERGVLTACDVPLALVFWAASGVKFADNWSVRRRVIQPVTGDPWPLHVGERRTAEAEASFLQFQDQLREMTSETNLPSIKATDRFRFLPAAGYLPIDSGEFTIATFFQGLQRIEIDVDSAFLRRIVHDSWYDDPIDLTNPPPILIYRSEENPDYILFARGERQPPPEADAEPADETTDPAATTGAFIVDLSVKKAASKARNKSASSGTTATTTKSGSESYEAFGVTGPSEKYVAEDAIDANYYADLFDGKAEVERKNVKVYARDGQGNEYSGRLVADRFDIRNRQKRGVSFEDGSARFRIDDVPPGSYHVIAEVKGFEDADQLKTLAAGKTVRVQFDLVAATRSKSHAQTRPSYGYDGSWVQEGWYDKISIVASLIQWPWTEPVEKLDLNPLDDPRPDEAEQWLTEWAIWLKEQHPEAPVDPGGIAIYINGAHTPESTPDEAYAYAVFGDEGAYVPIVLTPADRTLDQQIVLDKSEVAGVDREVAERLEAFGVASVDVLSASWTGLVSGVLDIDATAAGALINDARDQVVVLQNSLLGFSGVDSQVNAALKATPFDNPVAIANAGAADLVQAVGQPALMTDAFAERLISEARRIVSADQWSLESSQLQLKEQEIAALNALGVTTLKAFTDLAGTAAGAQSIAGALNVAPEQVTALGQQVTIKNAGDLAAERAAAGAVTGVLGVTREMGRTLANLGFGTIGGLAAADPAALAGAFGGRSDLAASAIANAKLKLGI